MESVCIGIPGKDGSLEDAESVAFSVKEEKIPYPKSVFFILSTETCERFSYYGMRGKNQHSYSMQWFSCSV